MALELVEFAPSTIGDERILEIVRCGEEAIDRLKRESPEGDLAGFVPADYQLVAGALAELKSHPLLAGDLFLEWGCGTGIATVIAATLGYEAGGIEILPDLVESAEELAAQFEVDCDFACGSFVPSTAQDAVDSLDDVGWLNAGGMDGHELLDLRPDEIDLCYAYPWPGEEQLITRLFDKVAGSGALLITYNGIEGLQLFRRS